MFRNIEGDLGTHGFCILVLESFLSALCQCKIKSKKELLNQFEEILELLENVKPKYAILIDSFYKIIRHAKNNPVNKIKENILSIRKEYEKEMKDLTKLSSSIKANGKNILIFDHSHSVQNVLRYLYKSGQKFTVLVAEQDLKKTEDNILFLSKSKIPFKVVPAYMISHLEEEIDMAFFGGVTFQKGEQLVMDTGSKSIISELKIEKKPIYVFMSTSKFSLWRVKDFQKEIHVKSDIKIHSDSKEVQFERIKFSHDRVPVELIDWIVTEKNIFTPKELKKEFEKLFKERQKERGEIRKLSKKDN